MRCTYTVTAEGFAVGTITDRVAGHAEFVCTPRATAVRGDRQWWASRDPGRCAAVADRWIRPYRGVAFPVDVIQVFSPPDLAGYLREMADHAVIDEDTYDPDEYVDIDECIEESGCVDVVAGGWKATVEITEPDRVRHNSVLMPFHSNEVVPPQESASNSHLLWVLCTIESFDENAAAVRTAVLAVMPENTEPNEPAPDLAPQRDSQRRLAKLRASAKSSLWIYENLAVHLDSAEAVKVSATAIDDTWRSTRCDCVVTRDHYATGTLTESWGRAEFVVSPQAVAVRGNESWWTGRSVDNTGVTPDEWICPAGSTGFDLDIADTFAPARLADLFRLLCTCATAEPTPGEDASSDLGEQIEPTGSNGADTGSWMLFHNISEPWPWAGRFLAPIRSSQLVLPGERVPELHRGWIVFHIENVTADAAAARATVNGVVEQSHGL